MHKEMFCINSVWNEFIQECKQLAYHICQNVLYSRYFGCLHLEKLIIKDKDAQ